MDVFIEALFPLIGTLIGTFAGIITSAKLTNYRIEQLEKKVEKHNSVVSRTYIVEHDIENINRRIDDIEHEIHSPKSN